MTMREGLRMAGREGLRMTKDRRLAMVRAGEKKSGDPGAPRGHRHLYR